MLQDCYRRQQVQYSFFFSLATCTDLPANRANLVGYIWKNKTSNAARKDENSTRRGGNNFNLLEHQAIIKEETTQFDQQGFIIETSSPYPSVQVFNDSSKVSSKHGSISGSPLVVLPLQEETISSQPEVSTKHFTPTVKLGNIYRNLTSSQQLTKRISRANELEEYAKQYEDLYTRRMGTLGCNSSTSHSGSVPSASGSFCRDYRNQYDRGKIRSPQNYGYSGLEQDSKSTPISSPNTPISLELDFTDQEEYKSSTKNHDNIAEWIKSHHIFRSDASINKNARVDIEKGNEAIDDHDKTSMEYVCDNMIEKLGHIESDYPKKRDNSTSVHNNNDQPGDSNKPKASEVKCVKGPGVKNLVSAFNEQIESQKVR